MTEFGTSLYTDLQEWGNLLKRSTQPDMMIQTSIPVRADTLADFAWVSQTRLFKQAAQYRSQIDEHKWYESERAGMDIGWHRAAVSYQIHQSLSHSQ